MINRRPHLQKIRLALSMPVSREIEVIAYLSIILTHQKSQKSNRIIYTCQNPAVFLYHFNDSPVYRNPIHERILLLILQPFTQNSQKVPVEIFCLLAILAISFVIAFSLSYLANCPFMGPRNSPRKVSNTYAGGNLLSPPYFPQQQNPAFRGPGSIVPASFLPVCLSSSLFSSKGDN